MGKAPELCGEFSLGSLIQVGLALGVGWGGGGGGGFRTLTETCAESLRQGTTACRHQKKETTNPDFSFLLSPRGRARRDFWTLAPVLSFCGLVCAQQRVLCGWKV